MMRFMENLMLEILQDLSQVPDDVRGAINFNGGGYDNHKLFWNNMKPNGGGEPGGALSDAINVAFGSFADFKEKFSSTTAVIQGVKFLIQRGNYQYPSLSTNKITS